MEVVKQKQKKTCATIQELTTFTSLKISEQISFNSESVKSIIYLKGRFKHWTFLSNITILLSLKGGSYQTIKLAAFGILDILTIREIN